MPWPEKRFSSAPQPAPPLRTGMWIAIILGVIVALAFAPAVFDETWNGWGIGAVMEENYGDGLGTLVKWLFGSCVFVLMVLTTHLIWRAIHVLLVLRVVQLFDKR